MTVTEDTIVALASAPGMGAISVIRLSGPQAITIAEQCSKRTLLPRTALLGTVFNTSDQPIDTGLFIAFPGPHSFTGEDVVEFQGHGGIVVTQAVIHEFLRLGAVPASPGQFSERAFLNGKLDLIQAEAISDLIHATSLQAVRAAHQSLTGFFSVNVTKLCDHIVALRVQIEAHLDFPDEDIQPAALEHLSKDIHDTFKDANKLLASARQGVILNSGLKVVLLGPPNAGKSSLLNCLAQQPLAIVTNIPGTTRDTIQHDLQVDDLRLQFVDTAGIRLTDDAIESEGIRRAHEATRQADILMCLFDHTVTQIDTNWLNRILPEQWTPQVPIILVQNKCDIHPRQATNLTTYPLCQISAHTSEGIDNLIATLKTTMGFQSEHTTPFIARERHVYQLSNAIQSLNAALSLPCDLDHLELIAEELRWSHIALQEMTGEFHSDDLLGKIFSTFCIGK
jgi:tRNA modification GTPase